MKGGVYRMLTFLCKAKKGRFQTNNNVVFVNRPLIPVKGVSNNLYLQRKMI